ncbi:MAG TPA: hypothetical protein VF543_21765 [Pyrinomonadaceae bacterium]|jgi:hypothetical protein
MATYNNVAIVQTFASSNSQNAWANVAGVGWLQIQTGAPDAVTNLFVMFNAAKANGRTMTVITSATSPPLIVTAYMN